MSFWPFGRFVAAAVRRWFPTPLRHHYMILWAVSHPHNEGLHRGLLPRRGPSVRSAPLACHRSSCFSIVWFLSLVFVIVTRYFPSRVLMTLSLVIVTCFAMSYTAVGCDCTSCSRRFSVPLHAGCATHAFELCCTVFLLDAEFRLLFPFCLLLSSVFLLNVASSSERVLFFPAMHRLSAECGSLCCPGIVPRCRRALPRLGGAFPALLPQSRASSTSGTVSPGCLSLLCGASHALLPHSPSSSPARNLQH